MKTLMDEVSFEEGGAVVTDAEETLTQDQPNRGNHRFHSAFLRLDDLVAQRRRA